MANPDLTFTDVVAPDDNAFDLLTTTVATAVGAKHIYIIESGGQDGEFSVDGGATFSKIPANSAITLDDISITGAVQGRNRGAGLDITLSGRIW